MTTKKAIDLIVAAMWKQRNLAHQMGLEAEKVLLALGLIKHEERLFFTKKERRVMYTEDIDS